MIYNADITHCSGYLCPLADSCRRFHLTIMWYKMNQRPNAMFMSSQYKKNKCKFYIQDESK